MYAVHAPPPQPNQPAYRNRIDFTIPIITVADVYKQF